MYYRSSMKKAQRPKHFHNKTTRNYTLKSKSGALPRFYISVEIGLNETPKRIKNIFQSWIAVNHLLVLLQHTLNLCPEAHNIITPPQYFYVSTSLPLLKNLFI